MPTIGQLPAATAVSASDLLPLSQNGLTRSVSVSALLSTTQPALSLNQGTLLGRLSPGTGGPEAVNVGNGLSLTAGTVVANGDDHLSFAQASSLLPGDEVILNSSSMPKRITATTLRSLFSAGSGVQIDSSGVISSTVTNNGSGTVAQGPQGDTGPQGPAGQGFNFRGPWQGSTAYSAYDVMTQGGQTYVATAAFTSGNSFDATHLSLMAAEGATGAQGPAGPTNPATASSIGAIKPGNGMSVSGDGTLSLSSVAPSLLSQGGASVGQVLSWTGVGWGPTTTSSAPTYTGAAPISVSSGVIGLSPSGAVNGQVLTWNGSAWVPQTPATGGAPLGSSLPAMDGVASAGTSGSAARDDHRHPVDTTRAPVASPIFTGSITLPTWTTSTRPSLTAVGMEGFATDTGRTETYTGSAWVQYVRVSDLPVTSGQLFGGSSVAGAAVAITIGSGLQLAGGTLSATSNYVLPVATTSTLGGIKQGAGVTIAADGTLSATGTSGVATFNTRSGAVTLSLADVVGVTGTGLTARTNLGLAAVASSGSYSDLGGVPAIPVAGSAAPSMDGTAAAGSSSAFARSDHVHPTDTSRAPLANPVFGGSITLPTWTTTTRPSSPAVGTEGFATDTARRETFTGSAWVQYARVTDIPAASGQLLGGSGTLGTAAAVTVGSGLQLSGGTLSATSSYVLPIANASTLGGVKQGSGVTIASDGTISATGTSGVSTFNSRSGAVTLTLADVTTVTGTGATARTSLGLAAVAVSGAYSDISGTPVIPAASSTPPTMDGTAAVGVSVNYARSDHAHPSDTSRLAATNNLSDLANAATARLNLGLGNLATLSGTAQGQIAYFNGSSWILLAPGTSGYVLQTNGTGANPSWVAPSSGGATSVSGIEVDGGTVVATTASPYQMQTADRVVDVNKTTGAATGITLPTSPTLWVDYTVIDGKGDAGSNNITVTAPNSGTINGASAFVLNGNRDAISFRAVNATTWRIV